MKRLKGKVAIVTGGASGIGKATAKLFLAHGANVAIWDIDETRAIAAIQTFSMNGAIAKFYKVNTADMAATAKAAEEVVRDFGKIDILINNAGITRDATLKKITQQQWQSVIDVNLTGVFNCTKAISPYMVENGYGRIITASSIVGITGNFGQTNYAATKAGVIGMTKVWARELGKKGITVNAIAPGFINTEMMATIPEKILDGFKAKTPLKRLGEPEEVAYLYLFLSSDEASFINGTTISIDGGMVL